MKVEEEMKVENKEWKKSVKKQEPRVVEVNENHKENGMMYGGGKRK